MTHLGLLLLVPFRHQAFPINSGLSMQTDQELSGDLQPLSGTLIPTKKHPDIT